MAVELLRGKGYDFDCDWWSLGCILFEMLVGFPPFCADTPHDVFSNVMNYRTTLENPDCGDGQLYISTPAWALITRLITEPEERLGVNGIEDIMKHPFFEGIPWDTIGSTEPPFIPQLDSDDDTSYFDRAEPVSIDRESSNTFAEKFSSIPHTSIGALNEFAFPFRGMFQNEGEGSSGSGNNSPRHSDEIESPFSSLALSGRRMSGSGNNVGASRKLRKSSSVGNSVLKKVSSIDTFGSIVNRYSRGNRPPRKASVVDPASLGSLSIQDWKMILSGSQIIVHPKDTPILTEGQWNRNLYRIKKGIVRVEKEVQIDANTSEKVVLARLDKHKVFGEMSFLEDAWKTESEDPNTGNLSAGAVAETEVELYRIDRLFMFQLFRSNPALFERFYKIVALMLAERCINLPYKREIDRLRGVNVAHSITKIESFPSPPVQMDSKEETVRKKLKFQKRFRLPASEFVISEFPCMYMQGKKNRYHGTLFIGRRDIGFFGKIFGRKVKFTIRFCNITRMEKTEQNQFMIHEESSTSKEETIHLFQSTDDVTADEIISVIDTIYDATRNRTEYKRLAAVDVKTISGKSLLGNISLEDLRDSPEDMENYTPRGSIISRKNSGKFHLSSSAVEDLFKPPVEETLTSELSLTQEDWDLILQGSEYNTYMKDMKVLPQGEASGKIYQIGNGVLRVEKASGEIVGTMTSPEMFGEISFLSGQGASVTIKADENNVDVYTIDREYILSMFEKVPLMGGKFYKFLALILSRRIRQREVEEQLRFGMSPQQSPHLTHLG